MKRTLPLLMLLGLLLGCKDPFSYQPHDPTLPDPPAPPAPLAPENGKHFKYDTPYPRDVTLQWTAVSGAEFYQVEVYTDSVLVESNLYVPLIDRVYSTGTTVSFRYHGQFFWRVRADNDRRWNAFTDWSELWNFWLPNPVD